MASIVKPDEKYIDDQILHLIQSEGKMEEGFKLLMTTHQVVVYNHVRRMVHSHENAADIVQNTFVSAFKAIRKFNGHSKLSTWLYRIATNEALTFIKKSKRNAADNADESGLGLLRADTYINDDEIINLLKKAISILPDRQKLVFNMRYYDEMTYQEISDILGVKTGGLKASFHLAVKKIEAYIKENHLT